jgi:hypothetical protein
VTNDFFFWHGHEGFKQTKLGYQVKKRLKVKLMVLKQEMRLSEKKASFGATLNSVTNSPSLLTSSLVLVLSLYSSHPSSSKETCSSRLLNLASA